MPAQAKAPLLVIYFGALIAFAPFSIDIYLASMPVIKDLFHTTTAHVQLTLSGFFVSFAIAQLFWGSLSDRIGRKPVVLMSISIFIVSSMLCALSQNIEMLIVSRIIQAFGACAGVVMAFAMLKDVFSDSPKLTKLISIMGSIALLAPMIAPIIGSHLLLLFGWRSNFYFLCGYGVLLLLATLFIKETYPKAQRKPICLNQLANAYKTQLCYPPFLLATLAVSTNFATIFAFISSSAFIYIRIYQLAPDLFGYLFAFNSFGFILGTVLLNTLKRWIAEKKLILMSVFITVVNLGWMLGLMLLSYDHIYVVIVPVFITSIIVGILYPSLTTQSLKHVVDYTGIASSLLGACRFTVASIIGFLMGFLIKDSAMPLAVVMLGLSFMTASFTFYYCRFSPR